MSSFHSKVLFVPKIVPKLDDGVVIPSYKIIIEVSVDLLFHQHFSTKCLV